MEPAMNFAQSVFVRRAQRALPVFGLGLLISGPALADRIDGKWCSPDGKHVEIQGRQITTPGGAKMEGDYTRHSFSYKIPAAEPESGSTVYMVILNEETMEVRAGNPVAKAIVWKRCQNIS
jgi:hypothetical protein